MKYMGSKARIAKQLLSVMMPDVVDQGITTWIEPFVGGGNMIKCVADSLNKVGFDNNKYLIEMFKHIQEFGFDYSDVIEKSLYDSVRSQYNQRDNAEVLKLYDDSFVGWVGYMASANGRFFDGGYSGISQTKVGTTRNYIDESVRGLKKEWNLFQNVKFCCDNYLNITSENALIYCDPPYKGTKTYNTSKAFDHDEFWNWCRVMSDKNVVYISEYTAPDDFTCVWQHDVGSSLSANGVSGGRKRSTEKLFKLIKY